MNNLPKDPVMLLSVINMKLRDSYNSLETLCDVEDIDEGELKASLEKIGYFYVAGVNQFK